ncbi:MAG: hypothetical protein OXC80_12415 [Gammaproteobacteria bacterium]|nr:hypothetical protein [Gammaproteobacteria bacterium]
MFRHGHHATIRKFIDQASFQRTCDLLVGLRPGHRQLSETMYRTLNPWNLACDENPIPLPVCGAPSATSSVMCGTYQVAAVRTRQVVLVTVLHHDLNGRPGCPRDLRAVDHFPWRLNLIDGIKQLLESFQHCSKPSSLDQHKG